MHGGCIIFFYHHDDVDDDVDVDNDDDDDNDDHKKAPQVVRACSDDVSKECLLPSPIPRFRILYTCTICVDQMTSRT